MVKTKRMDKLEYIPRDLVSVYVGIKKYIVEVIGTENENEALLYQIKFPNREIQYADKDNIVPIPLTPEILEKNGWVRVDDEPVDSEIEYFGTEFSNGVNLFYNILSGTYRYGKHTIMIYLHELQHLFFGLQLKHEMEV